MLAVAWFGGDVFLLRKIRALVDATPDWAGGVGSGAPRTGPGLSVATSGELAHAFDNMTEHAPHPQHRTPATMGALPGREERFPHAGFETTSDWIWEVDAHGALHLREPQGPGPAGLRAGGGDRQNAVRFHAAGRGGESGPAVHRDCRGAQAFERLENVNLRKDGRRVVIETSGVPIFDREGGLAGWRGVDRDITEARNRGTSNKS